MERLQKMWGGLLLCAALLAYAMDLTIDVAMALVLALVFG